MSDRLQHLLVRLSSLEQAATRKPTIDLRARIIVTFVYLIVMLSVPIARLSELLLYALFPIICAAEVGIRYRPILRQSLVIVPFAALIGVFNIFYHREATFAVGGLIITRGWLEFGSIIVRAVLSVQTLPLLVQIEGYNPLCRSLQRLGAPAQLTTQLIMLYRYIFVLAEQLLSLTRARASRSFDRRAMPVSEWGAIIGQLTVRTIERAERISLAMAARGFEGRMPATTTPPSRWQWRSTLYVAMWSAVIIACRVFSPVERLAQLFDTL